MDTTNQIFNWKRFTAALRKEWVENRTVLLLVIAVTFLLYAVIPPTKHFSRGEMAYFFLINYGCGGYGPGGGSSNSDMRSSPKGIKVDGNITVNGGTITISATGGEGSEGMESKNIMTVNGGYIEITSYDDALNSASHM